MRNQQEIDRQIAGLKNQKAGLPEFTVFGDNNWAKADAQLDILEGKKDMDEFDRESLGEDDEDKGAAIRDAAEEAQDWLYGIEGDGMDDVFSEEFEPITYKK